MPAAFNAAIAWANLVDAGTVTSNSSVVGVPPARVQNPHVARKWRSGSSAAPYLLVDFGATRSLDTIAAMGALLTATGTVRVRISTTDDTGVAGDAYNPGVIQAAVDARWGMFVHLLPAPVSGRYLRLDFTSPGADYVEVGRLFAGLRTQFAFNFAPGWTRGYVDPSGRTKSRGGQTHIDRQASYRVVAISFESILESERNGFVDTVDRLNGVKTDILLVTRSDSDNLARDSIWGLVSDLDPVGQPVLAWSSGEPVYQKSYRVEERL